MSWFVPNENSRLGSILARYLAILQYRFNPLHYGYSDKILSAASYACPSPSPVSIPVNTHRLYGMPSSSTGWQSSTTTYRLTSGFCSNHSWISLPRRPRRAEPRSPNGVTSTDSIRIPPFRNIAARSEALLTMRHAELTTTLALIISINWFNFSTATGSKKSCSSSSSRLCFMTSTLHRVVTKTPSISRKMIFKFFLCCFACSLCRVGALPLSHVCPDRFTTRFTKKFHQARDILYRTI